ncbi:MAG: tetratricopeptide repeat protein [Planctomycetes bacterium]|nr:tetratricopeptide repeat protein [Planctomycetota bacterium]
MSYLLETLGRGLPGQLLTVFQNQLPGLEDDDPETLGARRIETPTSGDLAMRLGMVHLLSLRLSDAKAAFESAQELSCATPQPAIGLACVCDELGQSDEALRHLSIAHAHDPDDPAILFGIGYCCERTGQKEAAVVSYQNAIKQCPFLRNGYERLAAIAIHDGDWGAAIAQYEKLAELEPDDLDVLLPLANLQLQRNRPLEAIEQYQRALLIEPEMGEGVLADVESLVGEGRVNEALSTMEELVEKYPGVADFHVHLGDLYTKVGDDESAIAQYNAALEFQPTFLEATVKLGTQHLRQRRLVDAAHAFNRAVELNDRLITAFVGLGVSQDAAGREHEAQATFDLAASLEPNSTLLFSETARLQLQNEAERNRPELDLTDADTIDGLGNDELLADALRRHRQALLRTPNHADLHYRHGLLLRQLGEFEEAIQAFRDAVAINPNYAKALIKLGICLKESGETDEAIEVFRRALTLDSSFVDVHYQLGLLFAQRNRFDLAAEEFELAVAGNMDSVSFRANLALALQNIGMVDRAASTWRSICSMTRDTDPVLARREDALDQARRL